MTAYPDEPELAYDLDDERQLIGAVLLDRSQLERVNVSASDFYKPAHETIWHAIQGLNGAVDYATAVVDALSATGELKKVGGAPYIHDCIASVIVTSNADWYAERVTRNAAVRMARAGLTKASQILGRPDPDALYESLEAASLAIDDAARAVVAGHGGRVAQTRPTGRADLTWLLDGEPPHIDPPAYCVRADGNALFYPGRVNGIYGDPESGKTWLAQMGLIEALQRGEPAAIVDVDHNGQALTAERLLRLGATPAQLADVDLFRYYEPDDAAELRATVAELVAWRVRYSVLDSIGELLPMLGVKSNDNDEITVALRSIASPMARGGACVITIDHEPKAAESRGGFAIGGMAKKRALDGTYLHAETVIPPAPGQIGKVTLRIEKDRAGRLREVCTGKYAGTFTLDSTIDGITTATVELEVMPTDGEGHRLPTIKMEQVSLFLAQNPNASGKAIELGIGGKAKMTREAIAALEREGYVQVDRSGQTHRHRNIQSYTRED